MSESELPPFVPPIGISTSSGTWDDWLVMRPRPKPEPGENSVGLSNADFVAELLAQGHPEIIDYSIEAVRSGMRELFAEFEKSTAGQPVLWRKPEVLSPRVELTVVRTEENKLRVAMVPEAGRPIAMDLGVEEAYWLATRVTSELKAIADDLGGDA